MYEIVCMTFCILFFLLIYLTYLFCGFCLLIKIKNLKKKQPPNSPLITLEETLDLYAVVAQIYRLLFLKAKLFNNTQLVSQVFVSHPSFILFLLGLLTSITLYIFPATPTCLFISSQHYRSFAHCWKVSIDS